MIDRLHPEGVKFNSPGRSPGYTSRHIASPERAQHLCRPFRARRVTMNRNPGRCPGLLNCAPVGLSIIVALTLMSPVLAQRDLRDIPDPDPLKELAALKVLDGFEINLFAAEPMLVDPIAMNFDSRGRLWVAGS